MKQLLLFSLCLFSQHVFATSSAAEEKIAVEQPSENLMVQNSITAHAAQSLDELEATEISNLTSNPAYYSINPLENNFVNAWLWEPQHLNRQVNSTSINQNHWESVLKQSTQHSKNSLHASYHKGRFSALTGYSSNISSNSEAEIFFLQGSYFVVVNEKFHLAVTAKFETLDSPQPNYFYGAPSNFHERETSTNATIGLIGSYFLTPKWTVVGAVTSTAFGDNITNSPLMEDSSYNMALIGTSYSF